MDRQRIARLHDLYRDGLLEDCLPFWLRHAPDREHGGIFTYLERDGRVYSTDKPVWIQARFAWLLARLWNEADRRDEWLDAARRQIEFLERHCFDTDGRMFFEVTADGRPLRKRRYLFTEAFGVMAFSEYARAAGDEARMKKAEDLFRLILDCRADPRRLPPKIEPSTRRAKSHAMAMILVATARQLRGAGNDSLCEQTIERSTDEVFRHFLREDERALLETVGPDGERLDGPEGRCVNPGHAIETAWFILEEARERSRPEFVPPALKIIEWSLDRGWDDEFGGILYFTDVENLPCVQYEHDMKLWWPHTEALYATLLAWHMTGDEKWFAWHEKIRDWAYARFPDPEYGDWFKYLHRDGTVSHTLKGNCWAGPFHLPRFLLMAWKLCGEILLSTQPEKKETECP